MHCLVSISSVFQRLGPIKENAFFPDSVEGSGSCRLPAVAPLVTRPVSAHGRSKEDKYGGFMPWRVLNLEKRSMDTSSDLYIHRVIYTYIE